MHLCTNRLLARESSLSQRELLITRLLEGDRGDHYQRMLQLIVGDKTTKESREIPELRQNAFYRSMAYWQLDDYTNAIDTLLQADSCSLNAPICNFYFYLKAQPLICRHRQQYRHRVDGQQQSATTHVS